MKYIFKVNGKEVDVEACSLPEAISIVKRRNLGFTTAFDCIRWLDALKSLTESHTAMMDGSCYVRL